MFRALITAVRTLTLMPMPGKDAERVADAFYWFPIVGAMIGGLVMLTAWLIGDVAMWPSGAGVLGVALMTWLTGALHLDGLGDVADAYYGGQTRERRLEIMKDPHLGAYGVAVIALVLMIKAAALIQLTLNSCWLWIPIPVVLARLIQVLLAVTLPYARTEGGKAEAFVKGAVSRHFVVACVLALGIVLALAWAWGFAAFMLAFVLGYALARWMKRTFEGVTGDLLGMASEVVETVLWLAAALLSGLLQI